MTAEATPQQVETAHRAARPRALLLVEDDADVAAGITTLLEGEGIRVDTVELGAKVIEAIAEGQPDAVILDVTLPDMSGVGLYENIARRWPDLPVLFSTGLGDERTPDAYSNAHNIGFLRKPYDLETLLDALEKIMSRQPTRGA